MSREYAFLDKWIVDAPIESVFRALADGTTYPTWWKPVYRSVQSDGPVAVGTVSTQLFKGRLPYELKMTSRIVRLEPPRVIEVETGGDLSGRGVFTLEPTDKGVLLTFDWRVDADKPLLRILTPVLRPLFRWNHNWAIERAKEGLEPYARRTATPDSH